MKKLHLLLLSLLSGVLLSLAWPARGFPGLMFIGMVPLLLLEEEMYRNPGRFIKFSALFYSWPGFLLWNALTTWWIVNSTGIGAALAVVLNSMFMAIVFNLFHYSRKKLNNDLAAYTALVCYWIAFEYLHLNWSLNWPWLNLGNAFAAAPNWVQWYEYTGALGGTLWIWVVNLALFFFVKQLKIKNSKLIPHPASRIPHLIATALLILLPILLSYIIFRYYHETRNPVKVVIVQPNVDPYSEQYTLPPAEVIGKIMKLAEPVMDSTTQFLVAPESAIQESMWENDLGTFASLYLLRDVIRHYPRLNIIVGGSTFRAFQEGEPLPEAARKFRKEAGYYVAYNAAILLNARDELQLYHKSKLTPGVESLPSFKNFKPLEKFAIDLGGTIGSLGTDDVRKVYTTVNAPKASAAICYESIFGEFFATFVKNGAQVMFIITNDGWWGNTAGHRQHFAFAPLRAIETRRDIARSANTGISAIINQRGEVLEPTKYWEPAVIRATINANDTLTFYVRYGDYLGRAASVLTALLLVMSVVVRFVFRKRI